MKEDFISLIKTKDEANEFYEFAGMVIEKTYGTEKFDKNIVDKCISEAVLKAEYKVKPLWFEKICRQISGNVSPKSVRAVLEELTKLVSGAELVKIEIAFEPSQDFINEAHETIKESGFGNFVLDIELNPKLKGGAKFFIGGKYVNLTFNSVIANYLRTKDVINQYL
ncbi:hypothetical protein KKC62_03860 [Patescibacteria group bacterium]|nr:hypothetical protein [Patescibacteria group bacterium]MBU1953310.1 hypothetical protein [Patescibacteria group bacterium]